MLTSDPLQSKIFDGFSQEEQDELKSIIENLHFAAGETILRQNQQAVHLYILVSGEVEIVHVH